MKTSQFLSLAGLFSALTLSAVADTFHLKNGKKIEGSISLETEDSYLLRVEIKKGIRDEITVKKSDIKSISKAQKKDRSKKKFDALKSLLPTEDLLDENDYKRLIARKITPLLKRYPDSPHLATATEIKAALLTEVEKVKMGEIKFEGQWLTPEQVAANQFEIDAQIAATKGLKSLKAKQYPEAFNILDSVKKDFGNTKALQTLAEKCLAAAPLYRRQLDKIIANAEKVTMKRDQSLARLPYNDAQKLQRELDKEEALYQSALNQSKASRHKWLPLNKYHPKHAQSTLPHLDKEIAELESLLASGSFDAGEVYRDALIALSQNNLSEANKLTSKFSKSRPAKSYSNTLKERKKEISDAIKAEKKQKIEAERERKRLERQAKIDARKKPKTSDSSEPAEEKTAE